MSFLLDNEEQAMLADALAFIDTFAPESAEEEEESSGTSSDNSSGSDNASLYVELRIPHATESTNRNYGTAADKPNHSSSKNNEKDSSSYNGSESGGDDKEKKKVMKSREANTRAVYRYRKRNKTEILDLREQVGKLMSQLAELRDPDTVSITGHGSGYPRFNPKTKLLQLQAAAPSAGFDNALLEYRKRQQSEALNRKLKDALEKQRHMNASLENVFKKQVSKIDLSFVMDIESHLQKKAKITDKPNEKAYSNLQHYLREAVYDNTAAVVAALGRSDINCVFYHTSTKNDQRVGKMVEFMSNTPLACSLEQLDPLLWSHLVHPSDNKFVVEAMAEGGHANEAGCERSFAMALDGKFGKIHINGMSAIHRFSEPHRVVFVFTSLFSPEGSDLLLRENGWLIMSDTHISGCTSAPTVFQTVYRLHAEQMNTIPMTPETKELRDVVMNAQGEKMRAYQLTIQDLLLAQRDWVSRPAGVLSSALPISYCAYKGAHIQRATASAAQGV